MSAFTACVYLTPRSIGETYFVSYAVTSDTNSILFEINSATDLGVTITNKEVKLSGFSFKIDVEVRIHMQQGVTFNGPFFLMGYILLDGSFLFLFYYIGQVIFLMAHILIVHFGLLPWFSPKVIIETCL